MWEWCYKLWAQGFRLALVGLKFRATPGTKKYVEGIKFQLLAFGFWLLAVGCGLWAVGTVNHVGNRQLILAGDFNPR